MAKIDDKGVDYRGWLNNALWGLVVILVGSLYGRMESDRQDAHLQRKEDLQSQAQINKEIITTLQQVQQSNVGANKDNEYFIKALEKLEKRVYELERKSN